MYTTYQTLKKSWIWYKSESPKISSLTRCTPFYPEKLTRLETNFLWKVLIEKIYYLLINWKVSEQFTQIYKSIIYRCFYVLCNTKARVRLFIFSCLNSPLLDKVVILKQNSLTLFILVHECCLNTNRLLLYRKIKGNSNLGQSMTLQFFQNTNSIFDVFKYPGDSIYNLRVHSEF